MKVVNNRNSSFPSITICNQNRFQKSKLNGTIFEPLIKIDDALAQDPSSKKRRSVELHAFSKDKLSSEALVNELFDQAALRNEKLNWTTILDHVPVDRVSTLENLVAVSREDAEAFGQSFEDFVVSCEFDQRECGREDFASFQHEQYGSCHTFNAHQMKRRITSNIGTEYGLKLILFTDENEYVGATSATVGVRFDKGCKSLNPLNPVIFSQFFKSILTQLCGLGDLRPLFRHTPIRLDLIPRRTRPKRACWCCNSCFASCKQDHSHCAALE